MIGVAVLGAHGRLGTPVCQGIEAADGLELVAALGRGWVAADLAGAQVAVDVTRPDAVMDNIASCLSAGVSVVVGTSGMTPERLETVRGWIAAAPSSGVVVAPNFSVGAVLVGQFAARAARFYDGVEIVELHHAGKADAPSGTAAHTAHLVADARRAAHLLPAPDATTSALAGARGAEVDGVHVHSVRLPGLVAHEEVLLGRPGELLTLRHDSLDRSSFVPGVLLAVRAVLDRPGLTVGLEQLLPD